MSDNTNDDLNAIVDSMIPDGINETDANSPDENDSNQSASNNAPPVEEDFLETDSGQTAVDAEDVKDAPSQEDSAPQADETYYAAEIASLKKENENWKKRFHDTQKAMHKANTERAELQKQLEAAQKRKEEDNGDDDWFSDSDSETGDNDDSEIQEVKKNIEEIKNRQQEYQQELARKQWLDEAEKFSEEYDDFEELVYDKLEPLLDETTGDPMVRTLYLQHADKTPAGAYEFAKKFFQYQERLKANSDAGKKQTEETKEVPKTNQQARGKAGLDRMNSAEFPEERKPYRNMVDEVFG